MLRIFLLSICLIFLSGCTETKNAFVHRDHRAFASLENSAYSLNKTSSGVYIYKDHTYEATGSINPFNGASGSSRIDFGPGVIKFYADNNS